MINSKRLEGKKILEDVIEDDMDDDVDEEEGHGNNEVEPFLPDDEKKKKGPYGRKGSSGSRDASPPCCQAERCGTDLTDAKRYHRRHKVCEVHAKAPVVMVGGLRQRFCQQCSRFHELMEFDESKRSCRRRLAGHNERRRKNSCEYYGEGSSRRMSGPQLKENQCRPADARGRGTAIQGNSTFKHFQIR
ncbi:hypothetical protein BT93_F2610 [Corymbia citriodora subsp. variegata]|nr:hypothetical protein BT93_F2610 [Corymbia citriodora subsp. variegata]